MPRLPGISDASEISGDLQAGNETWEADSIALLIRGERDRTAAQFQITVPDLWLQACCESSRMEGRGSSRSAQLCSGRSASDRQPGDMRGSEDRDAYRTPGITEERPRRNHASLSFQITIFYDGATSLIARSIAI